MAAKGIQTYEKSGAGFANGIATGIDWKNADTRSEAGRLVIADAVTDYFKDLRAANEEKAAQGGGMKTTRTGHLGNLPTVPEVDVRFYGPQDDAGALSMFRYVDKRESKNPTHQFANVSAQSIVFEQAREGEPAKIRKVTDSAPSSISSVKWHGALGIDDDASRFDDYGVYEENVQRVPNVWNDKMVDIHVALITALGAGVNETWDTDLITTLNSAGAQIVEDCGETYGLPDSPTLYLLYNHRRWNMVLQAMTANLTLPNDNNSAKQLQWNIVPVMTRKITTTSMYLALPGYDSVTCEWDSLYSEHGRDYMRGADAFVWRSRMNAGIGNVNQWRRITPA